MTCRYTGHGSSVPSEKDSNSVLTKWGPRPRERSVGSKNSNVTMVYGTYNELVIGANLNQLITFGGPTLQE